MKDFQSVRKSFPVFSRSPSCPQSPHKKYTHGMWIMRACCTKCFVRLTRPISTATYLFKHLRNAPSGSIRYFKYHDFSEMPTGLENRHENFMFTRKNLPWDMCSCHWCLKRRFRALKDVIDDWLAWKRGKIMSLRLKLRKLADKSLLSKPFRGSYCPSYRLSPTHTQKRIFPHPRIHPAY